MQMRAMTNTSAKRQSYRGPGRGPGLWTPATSRTSSTPANSCISRESSLAVATRWPPLHPTSLSSPCVPSCLPPPNSLVHLFTPIPPIHPRLGAPEPSLLSSSYCPSLPSLTESSIPCKGSSSHIPLRFPSPAPLRPRRLCLLLALLSLIFPFPIIRCLPCCCPASLPPRPPRPASRLPRAVPAIVPSLLLVYRLPSPCTPYSLHLALLPFACFGEARPGVVEWEIGY